MSLLRPDVIKQHKPNQTKPNVGEIEGNKYAIILFPFLFSVGRLFEFASMCIECMEVRFLT